MQQGNSMDLIIGGGKYGCHAVEYLQARGRDFIVIDVDPNCQAVKRFKLKAAQILPTRGEHFVQGGLAKAVELVDDLKPEYVFPTAPVHIAADMAKIKFNLKPWPEAINCILPKLPQVLILHVGHGDLVLSFNRDNHCQEVCFMPETCPTSGVKKPCTMTRLMEFASPEACILVSHSMVPGMGALKGSEVLAFFGWAQSKSKFVVGTACDCHGVFSAFRKSFPYTRKFV